MAQNTPILGKIKSSESAASLDAKYGPYASKAAANAALGENGDDVITAGLTVGITQSDGSIKEYWYQPDGQGGLQLVEKQVAGGAEVEANPTGEAITPLNKIKIGETNYNIPQTDTSNLATKQELQQGLSGKQDIISDLQQIRTRADEGHTALQPIQDATPNNFVIFDENGGIKDSNCNESTFIKGVKQNGTSIQPVDGVVDVTVQDGASAYDLYVDSLPAGTTPLSQEAWLASLKANIGAFKFVSYDQSAENDFTTNGIGTTYSGTIDGLTAGTDTTPDVILLMNNTDGTTAPTKTFMIATQDDNNSGYEFIYAGDLQSAMPSNVLTDDKIDNDFAGGSGKVAGAEEVKVLADAALIVPLTQTINLKSDVDWLSGYNSIDADGNVVPRDSIYRTSDYIALPTNAKTINYKGGTQSSDSFKQVAVYNEIDECLGTFHQYPASDGVSFDISNLVGATKIRISEYVNYISGGTWDISVDVFNISSNQEVFEDFTQSVDNRFDEVDEEFSNLGDKYYLSDPIDTETNLKLHVNWLNENSYIDADGIVQSASTSIKVSEFIDLLPNTKAIRYKGGVDTSEGHKQVAIYNSEGVGLASFRIRPVQEGGNVFDITAYPTAVKMRIGEWQTNINNDSWDISVIQSVTQTNKETFDDFVDWIDSLNQWKGKRFIGFGASTTSGGFSDGTSYLQIAADKLKMLPPLNGFVSRRVSLKYVDGSLNLVGLAATIAECQSISASTDVSYETQFAKDFDCVIFGGFAGESYDESQVVIDGTTYYGGEELIDLVKLPTTKYNNNPQFTYSNGDTLAQHRDSYIGALIYLLNELWKIKPTCRVVFTYSFLQWNNYSYWDKNRNGIKKLCEKLHLPFLDLAEGVYFNGFTTGTGVEEDKTNPNIFLWDGQHPSLAGRQRLGNIFTHKLLLIS